MKNKYNIIGPEWDAYNENWFVKHEEVGLEDISNGYETFMSFAEAQKFADELKKQ